MELKDDYFKRLKTGKDIALRYSDYLIDLGNHYRLLGDPDKSFSATMSGRRMKECLNYWLWDKYEINKILDLKRVSRCRNKFCPNCRRWAALRAVVKYGPMVNELYDRGFYPFFMTVTVPNVEGKDLAFELEKMSKAYQQLWRWYYEDLSKGGSDERAGQAIGAIRSLEVTYNKKTGLFHPHYHSIMFLSEYLQGYFTKTEPMGWHYKTNDWLYVSPADMDLGRMWKMACQNENITDFADDDQDRFMCDLRELVMPGGIFEAFKYCFKDTQVPNYDVFKVLYEALKSRRIRQGYGDLYGIKAKKEALFEPGNEIESYLKIIEDPEEISTSRILDMITRFSEYKKVSRFNRDVGFDELADDDDDFDDIDEGVSNDNKI